MKTVPNLRYRIRVNPDSKKTANTAELLSLILHQPPSGGFDLATMRARNKIIDRLEKITDDKDIKLEDADFATCVSCLRDFKWSSYHPDILKFSDLFGL